ncbi:MAG TPA: hypothetical protein VJU77_11390 [Chthoniobacterales bacterium]|nr:hypothetical protein [Chthoniobacterales bacterium]
MIISHLSRFFFSPSRALRESALPLAAVVLSLLAASAPANAESFRNFYGLKFGATPFELRVQGPMQGLDVLHRWNQIAVDASGLDHTPVAPGDPRHFGEQLGPARASRAMAIVHIAIFDSVNAIAGGYRSYTGITARGGAASMDAAIAQAAHDTLSALFPSQKPAFDMLLAEDLLRISSRPQRENGIDAGKRVATAILAMRANDGSATAESPLGSGPGSYQTSDLAGHWRQDPISQIPIALGAHWGDCTPFVLQATTQFRTPPPPAMTSAAYAAAYNEVKSVGGDGIVTPTTRTADQTFAGLFWAYDGTPSLCAPPRLYNQIAVQIADQQRLDTVRLARLLALINVAMADTGMAAWESKFYWDFWRPITGIRESDPGTGPQGLGDDNPATVGDPAFTPLGAPASNLTGPNFTPPFPAYPSGHAAFGGALFQVFRRFYATDRVGFTFVSDEFNGVTRGNDGIMRPYMPRSFSTFSQAEEENGQSRIYLGIHWSFDKTEGIAQGRRVADYVFDRVFTPLHP